jgi:hypothetical protein
MDSEQITEAQRRLTPRVACPRSGGEYRRVARWYELEALRGYASASDSARYGKSMRWAAELAGLFGPGSFEELLRRSGRDNPEGCSKKQRRPD